MPHPVLIVSLRKGATKAPVEYTTVVVDRTTPLGNPFIMHGEADRSVVCQQYRRWLHQAWNDQGAVFHALEELRRRYNAGEKLALACWCAPLQCHAESIRDYITKE